ncbi:MAG: NAD(P)/FAD-dependent oxidoreductase [Opitutales bacterium]
MAPSETSCIVIGAGISGLLAATVLKKHGIHPVVLEKGRGVGGRMATRRVGDAVIDHGAQYFTVRNNIFSGWVEAWENSGIVKEWFTRFPEESSEVGHPRYIGTNGMTTIAKHLAEGLEVHKQHKVREIHFENGQWQVTCGNGSTFDAPFLLITAPVPQALELIDGSNIELTDSKRTILSEIRYQRSLSVLALLDGPSGLPYHGGKKVHDDPVITWIADNQMKGISPKQPAVTIHSSYAFGDKHWDSPDEERIPPMLKAAEPYLKAKATETQCHRWGFTTPITPIEAPFMFSRRHNLMLAGDGFGGPRLETAAVSGLEAAGHLIEFF